MEAAGGNEVCAKGLGHHGFPQLLLDNFQLILLLRDVLPLSELGQLEFVSLGRVLGLHGDEAQDRITARCSPTASHRAQAGRKGERGEWGGRKAHRWISVSRPTTC